MTNRLFISGLLHGVTHIQLERFFSKAGKVLSAKVILDKKGLSKGFGFVEMSTVEEAERAIRELNHLEIDGSKIEIREAKSQQERDTLKA